MRFLFLLFMINFSLADEHWFAFDQQQFPGFYTPLFTIISTTKTKVHQNDQTNFSFSLSSYERSIFVDVSIGNSNGTRRQNEQSIKLNVERADLLHNTFNHLIFVVLRQRTKLETYVNCKLIDSYSLYPLEPLHDKSWNSQNTTLTVEKSSEHIKHFYSSIDEHYQQHVFDKFGCKPAGIPSAQQNTTATIGKPLIRKMQHVIEKVQRRRQRARRHQNQQASFNFGLDSLTIVYKPNIHHSKSNETNFINVLDVPQLSLQIRYLPRDHLFHIGFNNENRSQFILYADKATDLANSVDHPSNSTLSGNNPTTVVLFLHITPTLISCYVNCELTDQEFIIDSSYVQNVIRQTMDRYVHYRQLDDKYMIHYHRRSTLILFNQSIEQTASNFFCLKLDKKNEDLLPDKFALRKFANALDMLVNSLDTPISYNNQNEPRLIPSPTTTTTMRPITLLPNVAVVDIHSINGYGSLIAPPMQTEPNSVSHETIEYDKSCSNDHDCATTQTDMKCQQSRCQCQTRYFWSPLQRRCRSCKDLSVGNRCFRLSNHKSTWFEANDYCQDETTSDDQPEYTMKLASSLNRTDLELIKQNLLNEDDGEQLDYYYWIGLTSQFDTRKFHQRSKRRVPTTVFRWYDNGETASLNMVDIWCPQSEQSGLTTMNNNELCVSLTSCGLYADDCQRNYRFLCEAV